MVRFPITAGKRPFWKLHWRGPDQTVSFHRHIPGLCKYKLALSAAVLPTRYGAKIGKVFCVSESGPKLFR
jgi:hypothetical protein